MKVPTSIRTSYNKAETKGLVDSGATDNFIHPQFVRRMGLGTRRLPTPKKLYNVDDTTNKEGMITHYVDLDVYTNGIHKEMRFLVAGIGREDILLGYPWLATFHPEFSWREGCVQDKYLPIKLSSIHPCLCRDSVIAMLRTEEKLHIVSQLEQDCQVRTTSTDLAIMAGKEDKVVELPAPYQSFTSVFSKEESQRFPPKRSWDHAIDFKAGVPDAINCNVYPMTQKEDKALDDWLDEQLAKGYIRPSISPYASSFFFIKKKDGKLRPVQDCYVSPLDCSGLLAHRL